MSVADAIVSHLPQGQGNETRLKIDASVKASEVHEHMVGKTVLITGVSPSGLGAEAARVIAEHSPKLLILASRKLSNMTEVISSIKEDVGAEVNIKPLELDLASQVSVRAAAAKILDLTPVLDVLINNAGIMMLQTYNTTPEGIEMHFGTNHIGHFLLTNLLMPALRASTYGARVINVSSSGARAAGMRWDDWNFSDGKTYEPFLAYSQSKAANLLFTTGLAAKLGSQGPLAFSVDPGLVITTQLGRDVPFEVAVAAGFVMPDGSANPKMPVNTPAQAVSSYVMAAYDPSIKGNAGATIISCSAVDEAHSDPEGVDRLWALSEELVKQKFAY